MSIRCLLTYIFIEVALRGMHHLKKVKKLQQTSNIIRLNLIKNKNKTSYFQKQRQIQIQRKKPIYMTYIYNYTQKKTIYMTYIYNYTQKKNI